MYLRPKNVDFCRRVITIYARKKNPGLIAVGTAMHIRSKKFILRVAENSPAGPEGTIYCSKSFQSSLDYTSCIYWTVWPPSPGLGFYILGVRLAYCTSRARVIYVWAKVCIF